MSITLLPPFQTPRTGKIIQFRFDEELEMLNFKSRVVVKNYKWGGLPATVILSGKPDFVPLSRPWQELWFEAIKWQANGAYTHDQLLDVWKSVTMHARAFTDQHSWDYPHDEKGKMYSGFHDYILGCNVDAKDVAQRRLACAGNIAVQINGGKKASFRALDLNKPAPKIETIWGDYTKIWWATETNRPWWFLGFKRDVTSSWPQLGDLGVPFLNIAPGGINYVDSVRIRKLKNGIPFSPYKG